MSDRLEVQKSVQELQQLYKDLMGAEQNFSALIMGIFGTGKTTLISTGRKPILIDSFDPRGTIVLREEIAQGDVIVRPWWDESTGQPKVYSEWEKQWEKDCKSGFFSNFGTYSIDSLTTLLQALTNKISKDNGRPFGKLSITDYQPIYATLRDIVKISSSQGCDFLATGHLVMTQDEISGDVTAELAVYKGLKMQIPLLFTEKYCMLPKKTSTGVEYRLLTKPDGRYHASTQLGAKGLFDQYEKPDIKYLLKKAGLPTEDKQSFNKEK